MLTPSGTPISPADKDETKRKQPKAWEKIVGRIGEESNHPANTEEQAEDCGTIPKKEREEDRENRKDASHHLSAEARFLRRRSCCLGRPWLNE